MNPNVILDVTETIEATRSKHRAITISISPTLNLYLGEISFALVIWLELIIFNSKLKIRFGHHNESKSSVLDSYIRGSHCSDGQVYFCFDIMVQRPSGNETSSLCVRVQPREPAPFSPVRKPENQSPRGWSCEYQKLSMYQFRYCLCNTDT